MKNAWHDIWGSAQGPINNFTPQSRILAGGCIFFACIISPADTYAGIIFSSLCLLFWFLLCRPKAKIVQKMTLFGVVMFTPYFLLVPIITTQSESLFESIIIPWRIFFRGILTMLICITTISSLSLSELRTGIYHLPFPFIVREILLQIIHQTISMTYETRSIAQAMAVRGVSGTVRITIKALITLPQVWLPRVIFRAENISSAMEVRGYSEIDLFDMDTSKVRSRDVGLLLICGLLLMIAFIIRFGGSI